MSGVLALLPPHAFMAWTRTLLLPFFYGTVNLIAVFTTVHCLSLLHTDLNLSTYNYVSQMLSSLDI